MKTILYEDNQFEFAIDEIGLYLCIDGKRYGLSSHPYEPCTYIESQDGTTKIVMHDAYDFGFLISKSEKGTWEWIYDKINPKQFCEIINNEILKRFKEQSN